MWEMLRGHRARVALSIAMVVGEALGGVLVPLVLGLAIDDHLDGSSRGLVLLAAVGLATTALATVRRVHDARLYASVAERASAAAVAAGADLSTTTARLNMLREVVEFLEYSMPVLVASAVALLGTLAFLAVLSPPVAAGAFAMVGCIVVVYALTARRTIAFNRGYNTEYERQVDVLRRKDSALARRHVGLLNAWLVKLADLDATNVAISLTLTVGLQVFAILTAARSSADAGALFSLLLYVFEFSATAALVPESWQEYLGLRDVLRRLRGTAAPDAAGVA